MKRVQVVYAGWRATEIGEFEVGKNDTVKELSLKIQDAAGVPPQYQEFSFAGHRLEEDEVIVEAVAKHQSRSSDNDGGQGWFAWLRPARTTSQYVQSTAPPRNARKDGLAMEEDVSFSNLPTTASPGGVVATIFVAMHAVVTVFAGTVSVIKDCAVSSTAAIASVSVSFAFAAVSQE
eukprot:CAMPEP_0119122368 /NCGR_PEP_ID=MMETSP1310-20130426/2647_1 /TAXON_ID=464262 /ORGANISM="Genus nov. species nov., Strain RCC2339" /LENGTH=176 /DNA_ID=CAMNT_0007112015 /DNA_START=68 /DNA_END=599 /DNA_ORIENTATION=+